jgi:hypothetical protein
MPKKTCFVIGPIGASPSTERDHADTFLKYIVEPCKVLVQFDYGDPLRADQIALPGQITTQIIEHLLNDDLVIADLTWHNPNVFYELALRHAIAKPVVQMVSGGVRLPFDVHASRTIPFSFDVREVEKARAELEHQITEINSKGYQASNLIAEVATLRNLGRADTRKWLRSLEQCKTFPPMSGIWLAMSRCSSSEARFSCRRQRLDRVDRLDQPDYPK